MAQATDTTIKSRTDATSRAEWATIAADGDFIMQSTAVINGVEYTSITAPVITHGLLADKKLSVGNCIAGTLKVTVLTADTIPRSAQVVIKGRITKDEITYTDWYEFGTFWIDKRTENGDTVDDQGRKLIDLECYDAMLKGNQGYSDNDAGLNWPKPMETVVARIAQQMGVQIDPRTHIKTGDDYIIYKPDDEDTLLDLLKWIGEVHGGNWTITPENKLRLVPIVSKRGDTYNVIDESANLITGEEGDYLVWSDATADESNAGGREIDVPVVVGHIKTFGDNEQTEDQSEETAVLGAYSLVSGTSEDFNSLAHEQYFEDIVGHGVNGSTTTSNYYTAVGKTVVFRYRFEVSVPASAHIERIYCQVNGHAESLTDNREQMCVQLVSVTGVHSDLINFKDISTSNTTITLECNEIPSANQISTLALECTLGRYGGAINGATLHVIYTPRQDAIMRVTMLVDDKTGYTAGKDGGIELLIEGNPYSSQSVCDALYAEFGGTAYSPYEMNNACYDPATELGDWIVAVDSFDPQNPETRVDSVLYTEEQTLDIAFHANAAAPGEEELDSEYPYQSFEKRTSYIVRGLQNENKTIQSEIQQLPDMIRLKADKIVWESTYSSMSADGHLRCTGAEIIGGDLYNEKLNGTQLISWLRVEGGIINGGEVSGISTGRITFEQTTQNSSGGITIEGNGYVFIDAPNIYVQSGSTSYATGQTLSAGPLSFTKGILTSGSWPGITSTAGPLSFTNGLLTSNNWSGLTLTLTNVVRNLQLDGHGGGTWENYTLVFQNGILV